MHTGDLDTVQQEAQDTTVWLVYEETGDYYQPETLIGIASTKERGHILAIEYESRKTYPSAMTYDVSPCTVDALFSWLPGM